MAVPCGCCPVHLCGKQAPAATPTFFAPLGTVQGGAPAGLGLSHTWLNYQGSGVDVNITTSSPMLLTTANLNAGTPPKDMFVTVTFSIPVYLRKVGFNDLDFPGGSEAAMDFVPLPYGAYGNEHFGPCHPCHNASPSANPLGCLFDNAASQSGGANFNGPLTSTLKFRISSCTNGAGHFITELGFDLLAPTPVFACRLGGVLRWFLEDGTEVPAASVVPCS